MKQFNPVLQSEFIYNMHNRINKKEHQILGHFFDEGLCSSTDESLETPLPVTINALCMGTVDEFVVSILCSLEAFTSSILSVFSLFFW